MHGDLRASPLHLPGRLLPHARLRPRDLRLRRLRVRHRLQAQVAAAPRLGYVNDVNDVN